MPVGLYPQNFTILRGPGKIPANAGIFLTILFEYIMHAVLHDILFPQQQLLYFVNPSNQIHSYFQLDK